MATQVEPTQRETLEQLAERRGVQAERKRVIAHVEAFAVRLEGKKGDPERELLARRLRALASDFCAGLHEGEE